MLTELTQSSLNGMLSEYRSQGYCVFKNALSAQAICAIDRWLDDACDRASATPTLEPQFEDTDQQSGRTVRKLRRLFWNDPAFWERTLANEGVFDLARNVVSAAPALVFHAAFLKPAGIGSPVAYHQDQALWTYSYPNAANFWLAVTPSRLENGCIRICPGSHLKGLIPHRANPDYPFHDSIDLEVQGLHSVPVEMDAGDVLLWDRYIAHGSEANRSAMNRKGVVMVFVDSLQPDFRVTNCFLVPQLTSHAAPCERR